MIGASAKRGPDMVSIGTPFQSCYPCERGFDLVQSAAAKEATRSRNRLSGRDLARQTPPTIAFSRRHPRKSGRPVKGGSAGISGTPVQKASLKRTIARCPGLWL